MEYSTLAAIPAAALLVVIFLSLVIKFLFQRNQSLIIEKKSSKKHFKGLEPVSDTLQGIYLRKRSIFVFVAVAATIVWLGWQVWTINDQTINAFKPFYILFGAYALIQYAIASFVKPYKTISEAQDNNVQTMGTAVLVPTYNEDIEGLKKGLRSLLTQTVLPAEIHVVDDGSKVDYAAVKTWLKRNAKKHGIRVTWSRENHKGKRAAQITGFSKVDTKNVNIIVTMDSDGEFDPLAIEEGLKPFAIDREVQSVAGVVVAKNAQHNLLARITDLIFVSHQQLIDRAAMSSLKSVIVNSGGLAFYRKEVFDNAIKNQYDDEYFMSRKVTFSDDSYLTLIALKMGKTVQQPTAIVFSDMPVELSHHVRQQIRWARGSFIRGWWRVRHLPILSPGFLRQVFGWMVFVSITLVQISLFVVIPIVYHVVPSIYLLIIPILFVYLLSSRYLSIKRSDMSFLSQLTTYLMAPLAMFWSAVVLRSIRIYGMLTCLKTGWGTRQEVEIVYEESQDLSAQSVS